MLSALQKLKDSKNGFSPQTYRSECFVVVWIFIYLDKSEFIVQIPIFLYILFYLDHNEP